MAWASLRFRNYRYAFSIVLGSIVAAAAALRFTDLGVKSVWSDEAISIFIARMPRADFWHMLATSEANMSLYYMLLRGWLRFDDHAGWVRLLSALIGVAVVPVVYWIGKEILSQHAGIIAALLISVNVFHIRFSQEARGYSLAVLLVALSFFSFLRCVKEDGRVWSVVYVFSSALALYAHFFSALALVTQLVSLVAIPVQQRRSVRRQVGLLTIVALLGSPLLWFLTVRNQGQLDWVQPPHLMDVYRLILYMTGSGLKFVIALLAFVAAFKASVSRWRKQEWSMETWSFLVLVLWLMLPIGLTFIVSVWKPIYAPRFLIICLPATLLLIAYGLAEVGNIWACNALVALLTVSAIAPIRSYYAEPGQEDWKGAVAYLTRNASTGDVAFFTNAYCEFPLRYTLDHADTISRLPLILSDATQDQQLKTTGHIWAISCATTKKIAAPPAINDYRLEHITELRGIQIVELSKGAHPELGK